MTVDYIIVGSGLAGILFSQKLKSQHKSFVIIDDGSQKSSLVAGGLYNPVVLKRFTPVWKAKEQLELALPIYKQIASDLQIDIDYKIPVYRLFASIEEQNNWFLAADKPRLSAYLDTDIKTVKNDVIKADFGYGQVLDTGRINTNVLINAFKAFHKQNGNYLETSFDYDALTIDDNYVSYKDVNAKHIVFAEGFGLKKNPYFNDLPLNGTKGELLIIHAPKLSIDFVLKSSVFLIPLGADRYILGATYEWTDKTNNTTKQAKETLLKKLETFIDCNFTIEDQIAGIRPTVIDRRPLVGTHDVHKNLHVLNGLGTRGVMLAPYAAKQLFDHIELEMPLEPEIDIQRFKAKK